MNSRTLNTGFSMPYLLTSSDIDFNVSLPESNRKTWNGENADIFYSSLHDENFDVFLFSDSDEYCGDADNMIGKIDNLKEIEYEVKTNSFKTYISLLKLSCYKYFPYFVKGFFLSQGQMK